jgi:hypothetical protein
MATEVSGRELEKLRAAKLRSDHRERPNITLVKLLSCCAGFGEVSVFRVSLRCEAAPKIGCGLRSKPVLQDLERLPGIREAWLNEAGNLIAVAGTQTATVAEGADPVLAVFRKHRIAVEQLHGKRFVRALKDLASRSGWYRGADVDRLSEEEARAIAARFVARLRARLALPDRRAIALEAAVEKACVNQLIRVPTHSAVARKRRLASAVLAAARDQLDAREYAAFADVVKLGHKPLRGER